MMTVESWFVLDLSLPCLFTSGMTKMVPSTEMLISTNLKVAICYKCKTRVTELEVIDCDLV